MLKSFLLQFGLVCLAASPHAETVLSLIQRGQLEEARDSLSAAASAAARDGNLLFYQGLMTPDAGTAAAQFEAALDASVNTRYQEEIYYRLAQYYFVKKDYHKVARLLTEYQARWGDGRYAGQVIRLSALLDELAGDFDAALRQCDRFLVACPSGEVAQWGQIDKARVMQAHDKTIGKGSILKQLTREKSGEGIPQALYFLGAEALKKRQSDDAIFYYNLLRESYPDAVGLDELLGGLAEMPEKAASSQAEKLTGTYYSVKVGVFSDRANAKRRADDFKRHGQKVETATKEISGKTYHVVYVGRYQDYLEALNFKTQLEATYNEVFQVVTR